MPQIRVERGFKRSLNVPNDFLELKPSSMGSQKPEPIFQNEIVEGMYDDDFVASDIFSKDIASVFCRRHDTEYRGIPSWSGFNVLLTKSKQPQTVVGYLPIINAPSH